MSNINQDIAPFVREWQGGVLRVLTLSMRRRKIGKSGDLKRNLKGKVRETSTSVIATITMPAQGRFVDMGAGSGQTAKAARSGRTTRRRKKPWYNKNVYGALNSLQGAVGFTVATDIINDFKEAMPKKIIL